MRDLVGVSGTSELEDDFSSARDGVGRSELLVQKEDSLGLGEGK